MASDVEVVSSLNVIIDKLYIVILFPRRQRKNSVVLGACILPPPPGAATGAECTAWYLHLYI